MQAGSFGHQTSACDTMCGEYSLQDLRHGKKASVDSRDCKGGLGQGYGTV